MSSKEGSGGFRKRKHDNFPHNQRREGKDVNSSSPVMLAFKSFQQELDARHDKYERLVKLSRDITVESKRTIFLLHRITSAPDMEEILTESEVKLDGVRQKILQVAQELSGEDMHQFHRAITTVLFPELIFVLGNHINNLFTAGAPGCLSQGCVTLDVRVVSSSPTLGVEVT
uniref:Translin associated factor X n=1 Tax=Felis catus TaxID=9685 RepID=A0ABI7XF12_FELCA